MRTFFTILALAAVAAADVSHLRSPEADAVVVRQDSDVFVDQYSFGYETSNGIQAQEQGVLQNAGREDEAIAAQGSFSYTAPNGEKINVQYVSDANGGFQPQGSHLPTPPPPEAVPEYILRALEYIRTHPPKQEKL